MVKNPFKKKAGKRAKKAKGPARSPDSVYLSCNKHQECAQRELVSNWPAILNDHGCPNKHLPPVYKRLGNSPAGTDLSSIFLDTSLFTSKCGEYGTLFDTPSGCFPLLESVGLSSHELGHMEYVERSQSEDARYKYAVLKGIRKAGKNPTPNFVHLISNVISDELIDWRSFDGEVKGSFEYGTVSKWLKKRYYTPGPRSIIKAHFAIEDDLSGNYIGVDDRDVRDVKQEALPILHKNRDKNKWPALFEDLAEVFARHFNEGQSGGYAPDVTSGPVDPDTFTLSDGMANDPTLCPADLQTVLDSMNPEGTRWGNGRPVPPDERYSKDTLRLYYRQLARRIRFAHSQIPQVHVVKTGSEVWTPEKSLPNIVESVYNPLFVPNGGNLEARLVPYINIKSDVQGVQKGPDFKSEKRPRLLIVQDESSSMGGHTHGTKTWYRSIGTMSAVRSAVSSGMSCGIIGFSSGGQYHVNDGLPSRDPWTRNLTKLDDAAIHHYNGGTMLPPVGWVAKTTVDPILTILYTDGDIGNIGSQLEDLSPLASGKNRMLTFLLGAGAASNEGMFKSIGAVVYKPVDLDDFLLTLNKYTSDVYGGKK